MPLHCLAENVKCRCVTDEVRYLADILLRASSYGVDLVDLSHTVAPASVRTEGEGTGGRRGERGLGRGEDHDLGQLHVRQLGLVSCPILLRACYAITGTHLAGIVLRACYAITGTHLAGIVLRAGYAVPSTHLVGAVLPGLHGPRSLLHTPCAQQQRQRPLQRPLVGEWLFA
eukprot:1114987-Rhodomonas_salina.1